MQLELEYLRIESRILRCKLGKSRIRFTDEERITLAKAAELLEIEYLRVEHRVLGSKLGG